MTTFVDNSGNEVWTETSGMHTIGAPEPVPDDPPIPPLLDRRLVHKRFESNVLVSSVGRASDSQGAAGSDCFIGKLFVHRDHDFFFEHPRHHVPGLYLVEAARQTAIAILHSFYDVPFDVQFVMTDLDITFRKLANIFDPLTTMTQMSRHAHRKGRLASIYACVGISQNGSEVAQVAGGIVLMERSLLQRLERRTPSA